MAFLISAENFVKTYMEKSLLWLPVFIFLNIFLVGCGTTSVSKSKEFSLESDTALIMLSTQEEPNDRKYENGLLRFGNTLVTAGIWELMDVYSLHITGFNESDESLSNRNIFTGATYELKHSVKTEKLAKQQKWHVIEIKPGDYVISALEYNAYQEERKTTFSKGTLKFYAKAGEVLYLGNHIYGIGYTPYVAEIKWDEESALKKLSEYTDISVPLRKVEFEISKFKK